MSRRTRTYNLSKPSHGYNMSAESAALRKEPIEDHDEPFEHDAPKQRVIPVVELGRQTTKLAIHFNGQPLTDELADEAWEAYVEDFFENGQGIIDDHASTDPIPDEIAHLDFDLVDDTPLLINRDDSVHSKSRRGEDDRSFYGSHDTSKTKVRK